MFGGFSRHCDPWPEKSHGCDRLCLTDDCLCAPERLLVWPNVCESRFMTYVSKYVLQIHVYQKTLRRKGS